jgi:hypothetical protein
MRTSENMLANANFVFFRSIRVGLHRCLVEFDSVPRG